MGWIRQSLKYQDTLVKGLYPQWTSAGSKLWFYICYGIIVFFHSLTVLNGCKYPLVFQTKPEFQHFSYGDTIQPWRSITSCYWFLVLSCVVNKLYLVQLVQVRPPQPLRANLIRPQLKLHGVWAVGFSAKYSIAWLSLTWVHSNRKFFADIISLQTPDSK